MNRYLILAAACALALTSCAKEDSGASADESGRTFYEGQQMTLSVKAGEPSTKVSSELNSSSGIDFKWETGDVIKVTEPTSGKYSYFTLTGEAGESSATFSGVVPATGTTYDMQFPASDPDLTSQIYVAGAMPHNMMKFTATGCDLESTVSLTPAHSALRLNLYGTSQTISKIVVTNTTSSETPKPTYTLDISTAVILSSDSSNPTPFFIVVPTGDWNFTAEIYDNASTPAKICEFTTTAAKTFANGKVLNMPAKNLKVIPEGAVDLGLSVYWADHNVGGTNPQDYGTYFAWGDVTGQTWNGSSWSGGGFSSLPSFDLDENFNLKPEYDAAHVKWGGNWRMPTHAEQQELIDNCTSTWTSDYNGTDVAGIIFTSKKEGYTDKSIFFPAAGRGIGSSTLNLPRYQGHYWSSTYDFDFFFYLYFSSYTIATDSIRGEYGNSVRPVTE